MKIPLFILLPIGLTANIFSETITGPGHYLGEWKCAYIMNAHVVAFNAYLREENNTMTAVVDYPTQKRFNIDFTVRIEANQILLTHTAKNGDILEFKGEVMDKVISGSFQYSSAPGVFQLMKSSAKHIKGEVFPSFELSNFEGKIIEKDFYKGKYLLLDFWATWCPPCMAKRPKLEAVHKKHGGQLRLVSVSLDKSLFKDLAS